MALSDLDVLEGLHKGTLWLKVKKLRALGFVKGPLASLEVTPEGVDEIARLKASPTHPQDGLGTEDEAPHGSPGDR